MPSTLQSLTALAAEKSSEKRRELLREVTDLFFESRGESRSAREETDFDAILSSVSAELAEEVRRELAERFCDVPDAPKRLIRQLAADEASVAGHILRRSIALGDDDLVTIAHSRGQEHLRAIAQRDALSSTVSDAVAKRGDDETLAALASNERAALSRETMELMVDRAEDASVLHEPLVRRASLPPDLLNEMYAFVQDRLKQKILERNAELSEEELEAALASRRSRPQSVERPPDYEDAVAFINKARLRKELSAGFLAAQLREGETTRFLVAFAEMADIDYAAARAVYDNPSDEPLALVCKAAGLDRSFFVTLAILRGGADGPDLSNAQRLAAVFDDTPRQAAERVMRFWRVRKQASGAEAA